MIRYNAAKPKKFTAFPKYSHFIADQRYAEIARTLGLPAKTTAEGVESLIQEIISLAKELKIPMSIKQNGVDAAAFESKVDLMAERAFEDQCTTANPKLPLVQSWLRFTVPRIKEFSQKSRHSDGFSLLTKSQNDF